MDVLPLVDHLLSITGHPQTPLTGLRLRWSFRHKKHKCIFLTTLMRDSSCSLAACLLLLSYYVMLLYLKPKTEVSAIPPKIPHHDVIATYFATPRVFVTMLKSFCNYWTLLIISGQQNSHLISVSQVSSITNHPLP